MQTGKTNHSQFFVHSLPPALQKYWLKRCVKVGYLININENIIRIFREKKISKWKEKQGVKTECKRLNLNQNKFLPNKNIAS